MNVVFVKSFLLAVTSDKSLTKVFKLTLKFNLIDHLARLVFQILMKLCILISNDRGIFVFLILAFVIRCYAVIDMANMS